MKIYDYNDDYSLISIVFVILSIICIILLAWLVIQLVKSFGKVHKIVILLLSCSIVITLVPTIYMSYQAFNFIKFDVTCKTGSYESVVGRLQVDSIERADYRDVELYKITFSVNGVIFDNINSFSKIQKEQLCQAEGEEVKVCYSYVKNELIVYQILSYIDE